MKSIRTLGPIALFVICLMTTFAHAATPEGEPKREVASAAHESDFLKLPNAPEPSVSPSLIAVMPVNPVMTKATPTTPKFTESSRQRKIWWTLSVANHSAVAFDSYSTRRAVSHGARELNPTLRPFANTNALYPVMQASAFGLDYLSRRMMRSKYSALRKIWWLPQSANTVSSLFAGASNMRH